MVTDALVLLMDATRRLARYAIGSFESINTLNLAGDFTKFLNASRESCFSFIMVGGVN